jgi:hypothetical protein
MTWLDSAVEILDSELRTSSLELRTVLLSDVFRIKAADLGDTADL